MGNYVDIIATIFVLALGLVVVGAVAGRGNDVGNESDARSIPIFGTFYAFYRYTKTKRIGWFFWIFSVPWVVAWVYCLVRGLTVFLESRN